MNVGDLVSWNINYEIGEKGMKVGDLIKHNIRGLGIIINVLDDRIEVALMDGVPGPGGRRVERASLFFSETELEVIG